MTGISDMLSNLRMEQSPTDRLSSVYQYRWRKDLSLEQTAEQRCVTGEQSLNTFIVDIACYFTTCLENICLFGSFSQYIFFFIHLYKEFYYFHFFITITNSNVLNYKTVCFFIRCLKLSNMGFFGCLKYSTLRVCYTTTALRLYTSAVLKPSCAHPRSRRPCRVGKARLSSLPVSHRLGYSLCPLNGGAYFPSARSQHRLQYLKRTFIKFPNYNYLQGSFVLTYSDTSHIVGLVHSLH